MGQLRLRCLELLPDLKTEARDTRDPSLPRSGAHGSEVLPLDLSDLSRLQPAAEQAKGASSHGHWLLDFLDVCVWLLLSASQVSSGV